MTTIDLSFEEANELLAELRRAIDEAKDHQMTQAAYLPLGVSIHVRPPKSEDAWSSQKG